MRAAIKNDPLNWQAEALTDAQTEIKIIIKRAVLHGMPYALLDAQVQKVVKRALARVRSPTLREDAARSLNAFATRMYAQLRRELGNDTTFLSALLLLADGKARGSPRTQAERIVLARRAEWPQAAYRTDAKGIPLQMYAKDYLEQRVRPALDELARASALDPGDVSGRNSLRNLAEMQVRYEAHLQEIEGLREAGERLVVCSVHADCSDRCAPWQGKVYSLDGTSGKTRDGKLYQPLEKATDHYYTTKAGRTYKNGLLGFNCRHVLSPYREGMQIPTVSAAEQKKEYDITKRQREYERNIRYARDMAVVYKDEMPEVAREWREQAISLNKRYIEFSKHSVRAYYPDRTKIL